jgi:hypothetical protein
LTTSRWATGFAAVVAASSLALTFGTGTAMAAAPALPTPTAGTATANAATASLLGANLLNTGTATANAGAPNVSGTQNTGGQLLTILGAGVLSQVATFNSDGAGGTAACAGLVGPGGVVQIGSSGTCTVTGATGGITITLGGSVLTAQAILESCTNTTAGGPTATLQFIGAQLNGTTLTNNQLAPNSTIANGNPLFTILDNTQTTTASGISARGLTLTLLSSGVGLPDAADVTIGNVTCGTPAAIAPTPVFPLKSLPIAGGTALLLAAIVVPWYRRRRRTA